MCLCTSTRGPRSDIFHLTARQSHISHTWWYSFWNKCALAPNSVDFPTYSHLQHRIYIYILKFIQEFYFFLYTARAARSAIYSLINQIKTINKQIDICDFCKSILLMLCQEEKQFFWFFLLFSWQFFAKFFFVFLLARPQLG